MTDEEKIKLKAILRHLNDFIEYIRNGPVPDYKDWEQIKDKINDLF